MEKETKIIVDKPNLPIKKYIEENYIAKSKLKQIQMELEYEQIECKDIGRNGIIIRFIKDLLKEKEK